MQSVTHSRHSTNIANGKITMLSAFYRYISCFKKTVLYSAYSMCFQIKSPYLGDAREVQEQEDICILMAGSCCCLAETNKIPYSNYPSIKNIF